jgi:transposase
MSLIALLPELPGCSVEQVNQTEETIVITASATTSSASCPDCQQVSSQVHSIYVRSPKVLPSSGHPVRLHLQVRRFRCVNLTCRRKTFAETFPLLIAPRAQRTSAAQEVLRIVGEAMGGRAGARLCQQLAMKCSHATVLRLVHQASLPSSEHVRVVGVDEWAWRKGQRYGTILVDLERHVPIDLLEDATAESFAAWLEKYPTIEVVSRDRGTTFADGANRGAPQALQIADRWHIIHNMGEALEKVLARHHADLKRVMAPVPEEEQQIIAALDQKALARTLARSQTEKQWQARQERRRATFMRVQDLSAQGWSGASIARMLGIHKKTAVKYAQMEHVPEERSDRGRKLAPYLPFLHTQWSTGEQNIAFLYQAIHTQGYTGSETAVRNYLTALRKQIGQESHPRRYYPPVSQKKKQHQRTALSSRRATWLVLRKPETRSAEDQQLLLLLQQAHPQVKIACELAQAFVQMIRERNASVLEPWLKEATESEVPELRTFAKGIKHDQDAIHAALTYEWSQGQVEGQVHRLKLLKRQSYERAGFGLLRHRVLTRSA